MPERDKRELDETVSHLSKWTLQTLDTISAPLRLWEVMCFLHYQHEGIFVKQIPSWKRILELGQANVILSEDKKQENQENIHL